MFFLGRAAAYIQANHTNHSDEHLAKAIGTSEAIVKKLRNSRHFTETKEQKEKVLKKSEFTTPIYTAQAKIPKNIVPIRPLDFSYAILVFIATMFLYTLTMGPTITGEDAGELVTAAYTMGIAHPPAYPTWCVLGKLFTFIPIGSIAWRVSLMSAFFGAATATLLFFITLKLCGNRLAAIASSLAFACSGEFWEQSIIPEVYSLNSFFIATCILLLIAWYESRKDKYLYLFALTFGLSLGNHNTMALLAPLFILFIIAIEPLFYKRWKVYATCTFLALLMTLIYLYLPIRSKANPPMDWGNPETWENFWNVIRRKQYSIGFKKDPLSLTRYLQQSIEFLKLYAMEFTPWIAWLPFTGVLLLWRKNRFHFLLIGSIATACSIGFILLLNFNIDRQSIWISNVFFIPAYMMGTIGIGATLAWLWQNTKKSSPARSLCLLLALASIVSPLLWHYHRNNKSSYFFSHDFAMNILDTLDKDAIYFPSADHATFPIIYYQSVEGMRPDITIANKYGYPEKSLYENMPAETKQNMDKIPNDFEEDFIENWIIKNTQKPIYFTKRKNMSGLPKDYKLINTGLLYRIIRPGEKGPQNDYWQKYDWHTLDPKDTHGELTADYIIADCYFMRGITHLKNDEKEKALESFETALNSNGIAKESLNNAGSACAEHGLLKEAAHYFEETITLAPDYILARKNLGKVFFQLQQFDNSLLQLETYLKEENNDPEVIQMSAECMEQIGWYDDAIKRWEYLIHLTPKDPTLYRKLGFLYLNQKNDPTRARQLFARSLELNSDQQDLLALISEPPNPIDPKESFPEISMPQIPQIPNPNSMLPNIPSPTTPNPKATAM